MIKNKQIFAFLLIQLVLVTCSSTSVKDKYDTSNMNRATRIAYARVDEFLRQASREQAPVQIIRHTRIDTIIVDKKSRKLDVYLNNWMGSMPFRLNNTAQIYKGMKGVLGGKFRRYKLKIYSDRHFLDGLPPAHMINQKTGFCSQKRDTKN